MSSPKSDESDSEGILDVAVIGGGVSGAYSAWRLTESGAPRRRVALFELSDRIGGRLHSVVPDGMPNLRAEVGGMRFLSVQTLVMGLVKKLELPYRDFPLGDDHNLFYLRGRRFHPSDFAKAEKIPYFLEPGEAGREPRALMLDVMEKIAPGCLKMGPREFQAAKSTMRYEGRPLHEWGFWDLLERFLSVEAIHLIRDAAGYDGVTGNINCSDMIALATHHLGSKPDVLTLREGLDALPRALADRFVENGGALHMRHRLLTFAREDDGTLRLVFKVVGESGTVIRRARSVILAMPRRSLELLAMDCPLFKSDRFIEDLQSVAPRPAAKIFLGYDRPWWRDIGITSGRSDTDLPLRQCYYFGTEGEQPGAGASNENSLLMAGYHDGASVDFWSGFMGRGFLSRRLEHARSGDIVISDPRDVPGAMAAEAERQIRRIHGDATTIPDPYTALYFDWEQDPYGGAWHTWRIHAESESVMPRIRKPIADLPVHICGEAFSQEQGWVQGALHTAEHVLRDYYGMTAPDFVPDDHYLGP